MESVVNSNSWSPNATNLSFQFAEFEEQLIAWEVTTRECYQEALHAMKPATPSCWFQRFIEERIVPALQKIGFEPPLVQAIFMMAAPTWELMGPVSEKTIWFNPFFMNILEMEKQRVDKNDPSLPNSTYPPKSLPHSWIILPRAYQHLEKQNARTLTGYLKYLELANETEFQRIMARIVIEYVGNFALKYMNPFHDQNRMINILFYGYATMFWKTVRNPPEGMEEIRLCDFFLYWAGLLCKKLKLLNQDMIYTLFAMEIYFKLILYDANSLVIPGIYANRMAGLMVALRHGRSGIKSALSACGPSKSFLGRGLNARFPHLINPTLLWAILKAMKSKFPNESTATKQNMSSFLQELKGIYSTLYDDQNNINPRQLNGLTFSISRAISLINNFYFTDSS